MEWSRIISDRRLGVTAGIGPRLGRTQFESDVDRILFSSAFRRLGRKTQVHPLAANDHIHTRLTHSLEVSRVGNALGKALGERLISGNFAEGLPTPFDLGTIVQAACLAHDLGNPPFGHAGEDAIIHWFRQNSSIFPKFLCDRHRGDLAAHEGNAQGFRIITQLENNVFSGGLRLTYSTLAAFQKYPWGIDANLKKFGCYISESDILEQVFTELDIPKKDGRWCRHPLAYLVEAADDICYCVLDIEDAVELRILDLSAATEVLLSVFTPDEKRELVGQMVPSAHRVSFARLRGPLFDKMIGGAIEAFITNYDSIMHGGHASELFKMLPDGDCRRVLIEKAKTLGRSAIYNDPKKVEIEIGCYATLDVLLREFCNAALNKAEVLANVDECDLEWKSSRVLELLGDHAPTKANAPKGGWSGYNCLRRVLDFINGMTDGYAVYIAKQLQGAGFSGVQRP